MATEHEDYEKMVTEYEALSMEHEKIADLKAKLQAIFDRIKGVGIDKERLKVLGEELAELRKKVEALEADVLKEKVDQE